MDTKPLRLILLKRDSSDRIEHAAQELTQFLHSHSGTELLTVAVIEELDPATLDGSEVAVVLGGDGVVLSSGSSAEALGVERLRDAFGIDFVRAQTPGGTVIVPAL